MSREGFWSKARSTRRRRVVAVMIGIAIGAAVIFVSHPVVIWESLKEVEIAFLFAALLLNVPVVLLRAFRAQIILRFLGHRVSFRSMLPVQLIGQTSSTITPAASGDYVRAYLWRSGQEVPLRTGAAVVTFERLYSLYLLVVVAVLLVVLPRQGFIGWVAVAAGLCVASLAPTLLELVTPPALERAVLGRITSGRLLGRFEGGAFDLVDNLRRVLRSPVLLIETSLVTLVVYILSGCQIYFLLSGLGDPIHITQAVAVYATSQVVGILSTLPFGLGAADAILVAILAGYGVPVGESATAAVLLRAVSTLPQALAGLVAYTRVDRGGMGAPAAASGGPETK